MYTDLRLKLIRFIRKYKKIIGVAFLIWVVVVIINQYLKNYKPPVIPETTYTPHVSVMNSNGAVPKVLQSEVERMLEEYIEACNDGNYQKAFQMLSDECKEYEFNNSILSYQDYVLTKMPNPKQYSIQNYSNNDGLYTYQIKYTDDFLATGLTGQEYSYTEEKITFQVGKDGTTLMSVGNFIRQADIQSVVENDYLKIDVKEKVVRYSMESYTVLFTNRTEFTIVIADGIGREEVLLQLPQEYRNRVNVDKNIILRPYENKELVIEFSKFSDTEDKSQSLLFNSVRVMEQYSGIDVNPELIVKEYNDAISKFSMQIPLIEKK